MKQKIEDRIRRLTPIVYLGVIVIAVVAGVVLFVAWDKQQTRIAAAARTANAAVAKVQQERVDSVRRNCDSQNDRHKAAVIALHDLLKKAGVKPPKQKAAAAPVLSLINALAPKQNCDAAVKKAVHTKSPVLPSVEH